jgi:hypothetical protein
MYIISIHIFQSISQDKVLSFQQNTCLSIKQNVVLYIQRTMACLSNSLYGYVMSWSGKVIKTCFDVACS